MWSTLKAMPVVPKILIGLLVLGGIGKICSLGSHSSYQSHFTPSSYQSASDSNEGSSGSNEESSYRNTDSNHSRQVSSESSATNGELAQFESQQSQLMKQVYACEAQMNQAMAQTAQGAMYGQMPGANQPPCAQYMAQWTAQEAYLETEIYRLKTGDRTSSMRNIVGIPSSAGTPSSNYSSSDDGTAAVERYSRESIRGNSYYDSPNQEPGDREKPNATYYYRNTVSGAVTPSESPYAPNDGNSYEQLTYSPR
jgi:hypothetical protein